MISMVLTIGLLGCAGVLCLRSAALLEQASARLASLDIESLDRRTDELTSAAGELAQAVDLQG